MDELAGIRMFVRVVEGGSFVAAARGLGLSKSVITKRVKELEERLKAQLLVRSTRRLTLTDAGASYFRALRADRCRAGRSAIGRPLAHRRAHRYLAH
ncbi:MAG: LysR family transcriptional regulator [Xanthobacteraceae bacterium]